MQLQMEVCNLNECDFLETQFKEYETEEEFILDGGFQQEELKKHKFDSTSSYIGIKGIMMCFLENGKPIYHYAPLFINASECNSWSSNLLRKQDKLQNTYFKTIYWKLEDISCVLVLRNKVWFSSVSEKIKNVWNIVKHEREYGYSHRMPKPKIRKQDQDLDAISENIDPSLMDEISDINSLKTQTSNICLLQRDAIINDLMAFTIIPVVGVVLSYLNMIINNYFFQKKYVTWYYYF